MMGRNPINRQKVSDKWRAKNINPILYDKRDNHKLLGDTLSEWVEIRKNPFQSRSRIVTDGITKSLGGLNDPNIERVTWALQDPSAAKSFS